MVGWFGALWALCYDVVDGAPHMLLTVRSLCNTHTLSGT